MAMEVFADLSTIPRYMDLKSARTYVNQNVKSVPIPDGLVMPAHKVLCIDGRRLIGADKIGVPGGALGLVGVILSTLNVTVIRELRASSDSRYERACSDFNFYRLMEFFERKLQGMSCHTDDANIDHPSACAGCGHINAMLKPDSGYGLGWYRTDFSEYTENLNRRLKDGDPKVHVDVYHGDHNESAVMILNCDTSYGEYLSLRPNDGTASVFIVNRVIAAALLKSLCKVLVREFHDEFDRVGVSFEEFSIHARSIFYTQLRRSAASLACNLPVYSVTRGSNGKLCVELSTVKYGKVC